MVSPNDPQHPRTRSVEETLDLLTDAFLGLPEERQKALKELLTDDERKDLESTDGLSE